MPCSSGPGPRLPGRGERGGAARGPALGYRGGESAASAAVRPGARPSVTGEGRARRCGPGPGPRLPGRGERGGAARGPALGYRGGESAAVRPGARPSVTGEGRARRRETAAVGGTQNVEQQLWGKGIARTLHQNWVWRGKVAGIKGGGGDNGQMVPKPTWLHLPITPRPSSVHL
ncbi:uncharacterized protein LOC127584386 [Pristis pectinata]|uniref:uncharacterized protein LOC127584386 n=1 Tax=Pristis pectinata TaxID=685728 RepID=UPI00223E3835|nr:uncharacterized protein LOC127584386 [Pristis pectinata]